MKYTYTYKDEKKLNAFLKKEKIPFYVELSTDCEYFKIYLYLNGKQQDDALICADSAYEDLYNKDLIVDVIQQIIEEIEYQNDEKIYFEDWYELIINFYSVGVDVSNALQNNIYKLSKILATSGF